MAAATELAKNGVEAEVIDPRTIRPLDEDLILKSVKKTNRCVIVEEGWPFAGAGAEIAALTIEIEAIIGSVRAQNTQAVGSGG